MTIVAHAYPFVVGVDTHARTHALAVLAATGEVIDTAQFPATAAGMARAIAWAAARTGGDLATLAARRLFGFVAQYPFADGSGRAAG